MVLRWKILLLTLAVLPTLAAEAEAGPTSTEAVLSRAAELAKSPNELLEDLTEPYDIVFHGIRLIQFTDAQERAIRYVYEWTPAGWALRQAFVREPNQEGHVFTWHANGKLYQFTQAYHGRREGLVYVWRQDGTLALRGRTRDNAFVGEKETFDEQGQSAGVAKLSEPQPVPENFWVAPAFKPTAVTVRPE